ncbi:hypothetical protein DFJ74DRAFT_711591 [Hyaloraphidium curvatum]|nr:hypothetical protein DFJ74DRAFT_711591 [Hyaloraphidium curvatum]
MPPLSSRPVRLLLLAALCAALLLLLSAPPAAADAPAASMEPDVFANLEHADSQAPGDAGAFAAQEKAAPTQPGRPRKRSLAAFLLSPFRSLLNAAERALFGLADDVYDEIVEFVTFPFVWIYQHTIGFATREIKEAVDALVDFILYPFRAISSAIRAAFRALHAFLTWPFRKLWELLTAPFRAVAAFFARIWATIRNVLSAPFKLLYAVFVAPFLALFRLIAAPFVLGKDFLEDLVEGIGHVLMPIWFAAVAVGLGYIYFRVPYPLNWLSIGGVFAAAGALLWSAAEFEPGQH